MRQRGHHGPDTRADEHAEKHPLLAEMSPSRPKTGVAIDAVRRQTVSTQVTEFCDTPNEVLDLR